MIRRPPRTRPATALRLELGAFRHLLAAACALAAAGCVSFGSYCADAAACEGGNDADQDACTIGLERTEDRAVARACESDFEAYFECLEGSSECAEGVYDGSACAEEDESLAECLQ